MTTQFKIYIMIAIGIVGYIAWGVMAYFDHTQISGFLALNISMVSGTIGLALRDLPNSIESASSAPPASEAPIQPQ